MEAAKIREGGWAITDRPLLTQKLEGSYVSIK